MVSVPVIPPRSFRRLVAPSISSKSAAIAPPWTQWADPRVVIEVDPPCNATLPSSRSTAQTRAGGASVGEADQGLVAKSPGRAVGRAARVRAAPPRPPPRAGRRAPRTIRHALSSASPIGRPTRSEESRPSGSEAVAPTRLGCPGRTPRLARRLLVKPGVIDAGSSAGASRRMPSGLPSRPRWQKRASRSRAPSPGPLLRTTLGLEYRSLDASTASGPLRPITSATSRAASSARRRHHRPMRPMRSASSR